jgi:hypothetical protein
MQAKSEATTAGRMNIKEPVGSGDVFGYMICWA